MKLFKFTTKCPIGKTTSPEFVDWYEGETLEQAKADYNEDLHRYGLPIAQVTTSIVECNPETQQPL